MRTMDFDLEHDLVILEHDIQFLEDFFSYSPAYKFIRNFWFISVWTSHKLTHQDNLKNSGESNWVKWDVSMIICRLLVNIFSITFLTLWRFEQIYKYLVNVQWIAARWVAKKRSKNHICMQKHCSWPICNMTFPRIYRTSTGPK